jgi:hypothetical protein
MDDGAIDLARAACNFRERDVVRAVRAITAAGQHVRGIRFDKKGGFVVLVSEQGQSDDTNPWDGLLNHDAP